MRLRRLLPVLTAFSLGVLATACGGDDDGGGSVADAAPPDATPDPPRADAAPPTDARPADVTCVDEELPDTAPDNVNVDGNVFTIDQLEPQPVQGATVAAHAAADDPTDPALDMDNTDAEGLFSITAATGGVPSDAYLYATKNGFLPTRLFPPLPVASDIPMAPIPLITTDLLNTLMLFTAGLDQDPEKGILVVIVADCEDQPAAGATVSLSPAGGDIIYANAMGLPDTDRTTTSDQGLVFIFNAPTGAVTVDAEVGGESLHEHVVTVVGGAAEDTEYDGEITATAIQPHGAANL
ncbi:MAG TPA: hypothetical protein VMZ28_26365 [Kofleriaceae bacterium]|nr:hypothetical protein [Kofleriaceae bacterium]